MTRIRILPYRQGSRSARSLSEGLGGRVLRLQGSRFRRREGDVIINWGNTTPYNGRVFNTSDNIRNVSNKRTFFLNCTERGVAEDVPQYWTDRRSIPDDAYPVVCRTVLAGHSGEGIVIADTDRDVVPAPLYTKYIKKESEFRLHIGRTGNGAVVISEQKKVKRSDVDNPNFRIRNHAGGFVFQRQGIVVPDAVRTVALRVFETTGLDFGAVDVIFNRHHQRAYVLEINSAPGIEGQTVTDYVNFFRSVI